MSPRKPPTSAWTAECLEAWHRFVCTTFEVEILYRMELRDAGHVTSHWVISAVVFTTGTEIEGGATLFTVELPARSFFKDSIWGAYARLYGEIMRELDSLYGSGFVAF